MQLEAPIQHATLIRRYKRFLADVTLANGREVTAHCPNPGAMTGLAVPGMTVGLLPAANPKAKLSYRWELTHADGDWVGINTGRPNKLAEEAILNERIPELTGYLKLRKEVKYGENSRVDIVLEKENGDACYVEVKNVHLRRSADLAEFPDSVTARGAKHLGDLSAVAQGGARAVMLFIVQRNDCTNFALAEEIDPQYADAMRLARTQGVEVLVYGCSVDETHITVTKTLSYV